jgi:hypothetical protein
MEAPEDWHPLDPGDSVAELASLEHTTSLPIQVLAARGALAVFGGYAQIGEIAFTSLRPDSDDSTAGEIGLYTTLRCFTNLYRTRVRPMLESKA